MNEPAFRRALATLRHRGPDGRGMWLSTDRRVALGHTRLSIIDLQTGQQPLASEDGQIQVSVNGEFYGHQDIRNDLQRRGHRFATRSDSEILVHLYEEFGVECLPHLRGEFAFVLWDARRRRLMAARDRFGIKPLCYAIMEGQLLVASEAKALFACGLPPAWDHAAAFHAMSLQYTPPTATLFRGVRQVPPGHYMSACDGRVKVIRYWDLDFPADSQASAKIGQDSPHSAREDDPPGTECELRDELAAQLEQAVGLRLQADVPVCFHLSGGLDSSAIAGLAARNLGKAIDCFTVTFDHDSYDELAIAQETATHLGANLHAVRVQQCDLLDALPDALYFSEGLAINGHLPAKFLLSRAIQEMGYKVVLSGEGSDEIFAGYPHLREDLIRAGAGAGNAQRASIAALHAGNPIMAGIQLANGPALPLDAVQKTLGFIPGFLRAKGTFGHRMREVMADEFIAKFAGRDAYATMLQDMDVVGQLAGRHPVDQSSYLWTKLALANYILRTLGDGTEMAHGVEGRLPFLDHRLFELARRVPLCLKINGTVEKYLLREATRPVITDTVYHRQKRAFTAPPLSRFSDRGIQARIRDQVTSTAFDAVPFLDRGKMLRLLDRLAHLPANEQAATDPVVMMALSAAGLQEKFNLQVGS